MVQGVDQVVPQSLLVLEPDVRGRHVLDEDDGTVHRAVLGCDRCGVASQVDRYAVLQATADDHIGDQLTVERTRQRDVLRRQAGEAVLLEQVFGRCPGGLCLGLEGLTEQPPEVRAQEGQPSRCITGSHAQRRGGGQGPWLQRRPRWLGVAILHAPRPPRVWRSHACAVEVSDDRSLRLKVRPPQGHSKEAAGGLCGGDVGAATVGVDCFQSLRTSATRFQRAFFPPDGRRVR